MPTRVRASRKPARRLTIGLLIARIGRAWSKELMTGLTDAAQSLDVNLLVFVGGQIKPENSGELSLYELINPEMLDGLILLLTWATGSSKGPSNASASVSRRARWWQSRWKWAIISPPSFPTV
jgi:DNA-binding LacI/PurR family transcriptional regulator